MNDPIKIIWKYKNNNSRIQYQQYIFIGKVSKQIKSILDKIANFNFYDTLINLSKDEYAQLEKTYGIKWYNSFFNKYHVNFTIYNIRDTNILKDELTQKYGKDWFQTHIQSHILMEKKIIYSYESLIKYELEAKNKKKAKEMAIEKDDDIIDYTTTKTFDIKTLFGEKKLKRLESDRLVSERLVSERLESDELLLNSDLSESSQSDNVNIQSGGNNDIGEINISGNINELYGGYDDDHTEDDKDEDELYEDGEDKQEEGEGE